MQAGGMILMGGAGETNDYVHRFARITKSSREGGKKVAACHSFFHHAAHENPELQFVSSWVLLLTLALVGGQQLRAETPVSATEKAAIQRFESEIMETKKEVEPVVKDAQAAVKPEILSPVWLLLKIICTKMQKIKGEGLPADLKEAWTSMTAAYAKMAKVFKGFPDKPSEMTAWIKTNVGTDPAAITKWQEEFQGKFQKIIKDGDDAVKKLNELGTKYGLDSALIR